MKQQTFENGALVSEVEVPDPVPESVGARALLLALSESGALDGVEAYVQTLSQAEQISWNRAGTFLRTDSMLTAGASALGMSDAQVDALFIRAQQLDN